MDVISYTHDKVIKIYTAQELFDWLDNDAPALNPEDRAWWIDKYFDTVDQHITTHGTPPARPDPRNQEPEEAGPGSELTQEDFEECYRRANLELFINSNRTVKKKRLRRVQAPDSQRPKPAPARPKLQAGGRTTQRPTARHGRKVQGRASQSSAPKEGKQQASQN